MPYVDGFLLAIPKRKLPAYRRIARRAGEIWRRHGAVEYRKCFGDDLDGSRATTVLFELAEEGDGTRISVTETGFERLADLGERRASMEGNQEGWTVVLQWLPAYAEALR